MSEFLTDQAQSLTSVLPDELAALEWSETLPTVIHPAWWGGDSVFFEAQTSSGVSLLARILRPMATLHADFHATSSALVAASENGLAPRVVLADPDAGVFVMERLGQDWRLGTYLRLLDPAARRAACAARRAFHDLDVDLPQVSVLDDIDRHLAKMRDQGVDVPDNARRVLAAVDESREYLAGGHDAVPCHGDGATSNVFLSSSSALLVGWTTAAVMDPLEEAGSVITELAPFVTDAETVFSELWGEKDSVAFARARLFGVADDLRWAFAAWLIHANQGDAGIPFSQYGFLRLQKALAPVSNGGQHAAWMKEAK